MVRFYLFSFLMLLFQIPFLEASAQRKAVTGNIVDSVTGKIIGDVNIFESFAGIGTITSPAGNFRLSLKQGVVHLSVSVNGYKTWMKEFVLQSDTIMNIALHPTKELSIVAKNSDSSETKVGVREVTQDQKARKQ